MSRGDEERLADILDAARELRDIVALGQPRFARESVLQRAAERLLEIIGEAANAIADDTRARMSTVPWSDVSRLRILLAHHYHRVDVAQVWSIASNDIPALVRAIEIDRGSNPS
jgi:uncharacterized protein with HEPN domain